MDISLYTDGEQATAAVLNRPLKQIETAIDALQEQQGAILLGNNDWTEILNDSEGFEYSETEKGVVVTGSRKFLINSSKITIDPEKKYLISIRLRKLSGNGKTYAGVESLDEEGNSIQTDKASSYNYGILHGQSISLTSTVYSNIFQGYNTTETDDRNKFDPSATHFSPLILLNYQGESEDETVIESVRVEVLSDYVQDNLSLINKSIPSLNSELKDFSDEDLDERNAGKWLIVGKLEGSRGTGTLTLETTGGSVGPSFTEIDMWKTYVNDYGSTDMVVKNSGGNVKNVAIFTTELNNNDNSKNTCYLGIKFTAGTKTYNPYFYYDFVRKGKLGSNFTYLWDWTLAETLDLINSINVSEGINVSGNINTSGNLYGNRIIMGNGGLASIDIGKYRFFDDFTEENNNGVLSIHIKTSIVDSSQDTYAMRLTGQMLNEQKSIDTVISGYMYGTNGLTNTDSSQVNLDVVQYVTSDGYVAAKITVESSIYYTTLNIDTMRTGNGSQFNITSIVAQDNDL